MTQKKIFVNRSDGAIVIDNLSFVVPSLQRWTFIWHSCLDRSSIWFKVVESHVQKGFGMSILVRTWQLWISSLCNQKVSSKPNAIELQNLKGSVVVHKPWCPCWQSHEHAFIFLKLLLNYSNLYESLLPYELWVG
jgi:hypothetical protein